MEVFLTPGGIFLGVMLLLAFLCRKEYGGFGKAIWGFVKLALILGITYAISSTLCYTLIGIAAVGAIIVGIKSFRDS